MCISVDIYMPISLWMCRPFSNPSFSKICSSQPFMARALVRVSPWQRRDTGAWLGCGGVAVQDASVDAMPAIDVGVRRGMTSASEPGR